MMKIAFKITRKIDTEIEINKLYIGLGNLAAPFRHGQSRCREVSPQGSFALWKTQCIKVSPQGSFDLGSFAALKSRRM